MFATAPFSLCVCSFIVIHNSVFSYSVPFLGSKQNEQLQVHQWEDLYKGRLLHNNYTSCVVDVNQTAYIRRRHGYRCAWHGDPISSRAIGSIFYLCVSNYLTISSYEHCLRFAI